jgi:hypothetical protein
MLASGGQARENMRARLWYLAGNGYRGCGRAKTVPEVKIGSECFCVEQIAEGVICRECFK